MTNDGITEIRHSASGAFCRIHEYGATVLSYKTAGGREVLFVSRDAKLDGSKAIRGGIPLVFPIFGPPTDSNSTMPQHGFARNNKWTIVEGSLSDNQDSAGVSYQLELKDVSTGRGTNNPWEGDQYNIKLVYEIDIAADKLTTTLNIHNTGTESFSFQALFHTYYSVANNAVMDGNQCFVKGLEGYALNDKVTKEESVLGSDPITVNGEVDRVHTPAQGKDIANVEVGVGGDKVVHLSCTGNVNGTSVPVSVVVWNPYKEKAVAMGDFGSDQYVDMLCVEPGILGNPTLDAGKQAVMKQVISA